MMGKRIDQDDLPLLGQTCLGIFAPDERLFFSSNAPVCHVGSRAEITWQLSASYSLIGSRYSALYGAFLEVPDCHGFHRMFEQSLWQEVKYSRSLVAQ